MNTARTFTRYSYLGTTDEHTTCDCCGKSDLKSTVGIRDLETGEDVFFGSTCAARALKVKVVEVRNVIRGSLFETICTLLIEAGEPLPTEIEFQRLKALA